MAPFGIAASGDDDAAGYRARVNLVPFCHGSSSNHLLATRGFQKIRLCAAREICQNGAYAVTFVKGAYGCFPTTLRNKPAKTTP
jgi:hypothetical protein